MLIRAMVLAVLISGCGEDEGRSTDCAINPDRCEVVCGTANSEGPSFEYGDRQPGECDAIGLDGSQAHCFRVFDVDGNVGCCDLHATGDVTSAWYTCVEGQ